MNSLESQSQDRKARLAALRNKRKLNPNDEEFAHNVQNVEIKKRNFDREVREPIRGFSHPPTMQTGNAETVQAVSMKISDQILNKFKERAKTESTLSIDFSKPKNNDWDLKRDLEAQLDLLDGQTELMIQKITRERLQGQR